MGGEENGAVRGWLVFGLGPKQHDVLDLRAPTIDLP